MEKNRDNRLVIIVKIEKYIEYMLTILLKLPRTEKFSIRTEVKTSMYEIMNMKNWKKIQLERISCRFKLKEIDNLKEILIIIIWIW